MRIPVSANLDSRSRNAAFSATSSSIRFETAPSQIGGSPVRFCSSVRSSNQSIFGELHLAVMHGVDAVGHVEQGMVVGGGDD